MELPFEIGKAYFFRTVTYHLVGKVKDITGKFIILEQASWIGNSGRFMQAIEAGKLNEVEPVTVPVYLNAETIVDAYVWKHNLPTKQL